MLVAGCAGEAGQSSGAEAATIVMPPSSEAAEPATPSAAALGLDVGRSCVQPWLPVYAGGTVYNGVPPADWPDEVRPADGPSIDVLARGYDAPDTDGDGQPDLVSTTAEGAAILIERGDGQLVLLLPGVVGFPGGRTSVGDLDGDGRDDLVVYVSPFGSADRSEDALVVVPGSLPAGSYDPRDVGVQLLTTTAPGGLVTGVGDHDGDGSDDVAWSGEVVSGRALLAPGPGGRLDERPPGIGRLPERSVGVLSLGAGVAPVFVSTRAGGAAAAIDLVLHVDPEVVLRTARVSPGINTARPGAVTGWLSDGHRIVALTVDGGRSGDTETWAWDLDAPCAGPTPA